VLRGWCLGAGFSASLGFGVCCWGARESHWERREGMGLVGLVGVVDLESAELAAAASVESCELSGG
jgi:hypothetical protein